MASSLGVTTSRGFAFRWGERTYIMGVVNMTPDSFSGDGLGDDIAAAVRQAQQMVADGADIIDVGGESTRPGSAANPYFATRQPSFTQRGKDWPEPLPVAEELRRVAPVIERLVAAVSAPISVDTFKAEVAREAVRAGATMINDIWGLKFDPTLAEVAAAAGVPLVLMHNQEHAFYDDLLPEVIASLRRSIDIALAAGVPRQNIIIDPGFGFGKTVEHNLEILRRLAELRVLGRPILLGTSRKSTIGRVLDLPADDRLEGTAATVALGIAYGADIVRVHDVREMARVARMADAVVRGPSREGR